MFLRSWASNDKDNNYFWIWYTRWINIGLPPCLAFIWCLYDYPEFNGISVKLITSQTAIIGILIIEFKKETHKKIVTVWTFLYTKNHVDSNMNDFIKGRLKSIINDISSC